MYSVDNRTKSTKPQPKPFKENTFCDKHEVKGTHGNLGVSHFSEIYTLIRFNPTTCPYIASGF